MDSYLQPMGLYGYPMVWHVMFKDFSKFIMDLQTAINGELEAIEFYTRLSEMAPSEEAKTFVTIPRDDEQKHYRMLDQLYLSLTGQHPVVRKPVVQTTTFCAGVKAALKNELAAAEMYREMYLSTLHMRIRDFLFEIMTDEMEHATRFTFVYNLADCKQ